MSSKIKEKVSLQTINKLVKDLPELKDALINKENMELMKDYINSYISKRMSNITPVKAGERMRKEPLQKIEVFLFMLNSLIKINGIKLSDLNKVMHINNLSEIRDDKALSLINEGNMFNRSFDSVEKFIADENMLLNSIFKGEVINSTLKKNLHKIANLHISINKEQYQEIISKAVKVNKNIDLENSKEIIDEIMDTVSGTDRKLKLKLETGDNIRFSIAYLSSAKTIYNEKLKYYQSIGFFEFYKKEDNKLVLIQDQKDLEYKKEIYIKIIKE